MGTHLKVEYTRQVKLDVDGNEVFEIYANCVDEGQVADGTGLPDRGIFLLNIFNSRNALADIFQRVCSINDLETYSDSRDTAIANNQEYWRSYELTKTYESLQVAKQAVTIFGDRINTLVNDYATYINDFATTPPTGDETYPTADPTYVAELKTTYSDKSTAFDAAQETETDAEDDRDAAQATLTEARDSLKEWQETQDLVCGGNLSEEGNRYGLKIYVTEIANAFKNLYDGSGSSPYAPNADDVKAAMDAFIDSVENVQLGSGSTWMKRLTVVSGVGPVPSDIGRKVQIEGGAAGYGYLTAYDLDNNYWWVGAQSGAWTIGLNVEIVSGSAAIGELTATSTAPEGPLAGLPALTTSRDDLESTLDVIVTADLPTRMVDAITHATDGANAVCTHVTEITTEKATATSTAESALNTKEATYIEAQAATQVAYDEVVTAYDAVKAVCPDWTPDPPVPAAP